MGDILVSLNEQKSRLLAKKAYLQNASAEITTINQQLAKLNNIITRIVEGGWDA